MRDLGLTNDVRESAPEPPYCILALSGGGYRGLFTANVLAGLDGRRKGAWTDRFNLFAGTSIGGLLAVGLAIGLPARTLRDAISRHGPLIFDDRLEIFGWRIPIRKLQGPLGGVIRAKFARPPLVAAISEILKLGFGLDGHGDADARVARLTLKDVPHPFLVISACATTKTPFLMGNLPGMPSATTEFSLMQALLATSAAPGYFPALDLEHRSLVDGGLVANAPDLVAVAEVLRRRWAPLDGIRLVSIGTARGNPAVVPSNLRRRGLAHWARDLVPFILAAQESLIVDQAEALLKDNLLRIDAIPSAKQAAILALDRANSKASRTLSLLAEQAIEEIPEHRLTTFLGQDSTDPAHAAARGR